MEFIKKLFLPVVAAVLLMSVFGINTSSASAAALETGDTYSLLNENENLTELDGTLSQQDELVIQPRQSTMTFLMEWKSLKNTNVIPTNYYTYDEVYKTYAYQAGVTSTVKEENITTWIDALQGKLRKQHTRTLKFN